MLYLLTIDLYPWSISFVPLEDRECIWLLMIKAGSETTISIKLSFLWGREE